MAVDLRLLFAFSAALLEMPPLAKFLELTLLNALEITQLAVAVIHHQHGFGFQRRKAMCTGLPAGSPIAPAATDPTNHSPMHPDAQQLVCAVGRATEIERG